MMAVSRGKARGILMWKLRRKIGAAVVRANAMLLMDRVAHTGVTRPRLTRGSQGLSPGSFGAWYGMVDVCDGYLAAEASGSSFG